MNSSQKPVPHVPPTDAEPRAVQPPSTAAAPVSRRDFLAATAATGIALGAGTVGFRARPGQRRVDTRDGWRRRRAPCPARCRTASRSRCTTARPPGPCSRNSALPAFECSSIRTPAGSARSGRRSTRRRRAGDQRHPRGPRRGRGRGLRDGESEPRVLLRQWRRRRQLDQQPVLRLEGPRPDARDVLGRKAGGTGEGRVRELGRSRSGPPNPSRCGRPTC